MIRLAKILCCVAALQTKDPNPTQHFHVSRREHEQDWRATVYENIE
jgi:hypothetical protein